MDHHGNRPGAVAASQLEADNTVGVMLLDFYAPFILFPWRTGSSGADRRRDSATMWGRGGG